MEKNTSDSGDFCDAGAMVVAIVLTAMAGPSQGLLQVQPVRSVGSEPR